jgi:hypothetical protein
MKANGRPSDLARIALICSVLAFFCGCAAFPSKETKEYPAFQGLSVSEATRAAALAMDEIGFSPEQQNESAGFVLGQKITSDLLGFAETFRMRVRIGRDAGGALKVNVFCQAGKEVAMSTDQFGFIQDFYKAFERRAKAMSAQTQGGVVPAASRPLPAARAPTASTPSGATQPSPRVVQPAPAPSKPTPPASPAGRQYDL